MSRKEKDKQKQKILNTIPIFLAKTYRIVDNPVNQSAIEWTQDGNGFVIKNVTQLTQNIFPKYFKHGNFPSFVRQLNLYGFRKLRSAEQGQIFSHDYFSRDDPQKLEKIHRKNRQPKNSESVQKPQQIDDRNEQSQSLAMMPAIKNVGKQSQLEGQVLMLSQKHENLQNLVSILVQQNKEIIMQNKNFISKINKMDDNYRKKLETLIFLMVFGLKNGDNNIIIPQQLSNMIRAFTSKKKQKKPKNAPQQQNNALQLVRKSSNEEGRFNNKNIQQILQMLELESDNEGSNHDLKQMKQQLEYQEPIDQPSPIPSLRSYPSHLLQKQKDDDWHNLLGSIDHSDFLDFQEKA